ncbi:hypothetical protein ANOM_003261, partial [Aspergillus nomiae NRRL 13137]
MTSPAAHDSRAKYPDGIFVDEFGGVINGTATDGLGLEAETIQYLSKLLNLPWPLTTLTGYSSGLFTKFEHENKNGVLEGEARTGIVIQTPHSTPIKCLLALFHNTKSNLTTCFLYSAFPIHLFQFRDLLPKLLGKSNQPMIVFPVVFLKVYNECIEGYRKIQEWNIASLEEGIGLTDYYQYKSSSTGKPRDRIKMINGISYDLSRFELFIDFECRLYGFLTDLCSSSGSRFDLSREPNTGEKLREWLQLIDCVALSHKQAASSYRQRVQAQNTVLYSLVSQAESRLNYQVAASTKQDSSDMRAVALLTMLFLPGTFVATFFSAGLVTSNSGSIPMANKYLWIYWVITVPLTIIVVLIWKCWSRKQTGRANNLL